ncbi:MAG: homoserine kinase [Chloroflexi bacterium]|nr:homoserine kinase [Chloroflexota bacterium]
MGRKTAVVMNPSPIHLTTSDIQTISQQYDISVVKTKLLHGGHANINYLLQTDADDYVLTLFNDDSFAEIVKLARLLVWLAKYHVVTTSLLPATSGEWVTKYHNKPILVKKYIAGQIYPALDEIMLRQVGGEMARLHRVPPPDFLPRQHRNYLLYPLLIQNSVNPQYGSWLGQEIEAFQQQLLPKLPRGLIHGDIFSGNILFVDQSLQAIIDFEIACHDYLLLDIGMAIVGTCVEETAVSLSKVHALLSGYQQIRPLEADELTSLQQFVVHAAVVTSTWRFWKHNLDIYNLPQKTWYQQMVDIAEGTRAIKQETFLAYTS